jgi:hypothetical protein
MPTSAVNGRQGRNCRSDEESASGATESPLEFVNPRDALRSPRLTPAATVLTLAGPHDHMPARALDDRALRGPHAVPWFGDARAHAPPVTRMDLNGGLPCVGVFPRASREERKRLFDALEQALDVRFVPRGPGEERELSGAIVWDGRDLSRSALPQGLPRLTISGGAERQGPPRAVQLHRADVLDRRLRGLELADAGAAFPLGGGPWPDQKIVASADGRALWAVERVEADHQRLAIGPDELGAGETLRERFQDGRFLAVLPILELGRRLRRAQDWAVPPLRACFLFDDPNLHWPSYGHLRFGELARDAARHGYHVAMATVPLDAWHVDPRAAAIFAQHPQELSLIVHGNDHVRGELARVDRAEVALDLAHQALERTSALERKSGLAVGRIMAPPHGVCSEAMATGLLRAGFEALTVSRAYPWLARPPADRPLASWRIAEFVANGLPVIERRVLGTSAAELALLAYLDHPLILFGHHRDVAGGPSRLRSIAQRLAEIGPIRWESIQDIARTNFSQRRAGDTVHVRMYSRCVDLEVPPNVRSLVVELPGHPCPDQELVLCGGELVMPGESTQVRPGSRCQVALHNQLQAEPWVRMRRPRAGFQLWPLVRRGMTEGRDRSVTIADRMADRRAGRQR